MNIFNHGISKIDHLGVIQVQGDDASSFLQGQLSNDFILLDLEKARLAAFCSAKGRMQASFIGFKSSQETIFLICDLSILAHTLKRLSMFVLRSKVTLTDVSAKYKIAGLIGDAVVNLLDLPSPILEPWRKFNLTSEEYLISLYPAEGQVRALWFGPINQDYPSLRLLDPDIWNRSEVLSGVATLSASTFDLFVPQMLNYESIGGINFKKGCYPGQEVVARSQFRGVIKRRSYLAKSLVKISSGDEIYQEFENSESCGTVVQVACDPSGGFDAIICIQTSAFNQGGLHVGDINGPVLIAKMPPYELLEDI